jgi:hypothetical protein
VKWFGKYGRKVSGMVKIYGTCGRKVGFHYSTCLSFIFSKFFHYSTW